MLQVISGVSQLVSTRKLVRVLTLVLWNISPYKTTIQKIAQFFLCAQGAEVDGSFD